MKAELARQLRGDEDEIPYAYPDSEGYLTIGIGRLIDKRKGGRLRPDEIAYLFNNDVDAAFEELTRALPWFQNLDDARRGVLVNMAFNLGVPGLLKFPKTLSLIQQGKYAEAAVEMLDSLWAKQVGDRAKRLSQQMRTGQWQYAPGA